MNKGIAVTLTVAACLGYSAGAAAQDAASTPGADAPSAPPSAGVAPPPGAEPLASLLALFDRFDFWFEIVAP